MMKKTIAKIIAIIVILIMILSGFIAIFYK
jgi:hypothetical protein